MSQTTSQGTSTIAIIGGSRGIGAAIVEAALHAGHNVIFTARSPELAQLEKLKSAYPHLAIEAIAADLSSAESVASLAENLSNREAFYGFIFNAGQSYDSLAAVMDSEQAQAIMQVNFWAMTRLVQAIVRPMTMKRRGRIVLIGSVAAERGSRGNAAYAATKAAMSAWARTLAVECAPRGVTVNVLEPGFVDTDMMAGYADYREKLEKQIPLQRFAKPEEVASLAAYLLSPPAGYITGATLAVDGGLMAALPIQR